MATSVIEEASLNDAQLEAVLCTEGPLLVLAGAGSGKTRVLTYRIAHLVADLGVAPWQILAITFTNKAANEMRQRITQVVPGTIRGMWISTFHAMGVRMLREHAERLGYSSSFSIYDEDDAKRLLKHVMAHVGADTKANPLNQLRSRISNAKNQLMSPKVYEARATLPAERLTAQVYERYQRELKRANAMDFDDLLVNAYHLLNDNEDVLGAYQERFRYISVDEYQDTNHVQYLITRLLAARYKNLMVVGDDDQSIYSWRGADVSNILDFERDYPNAKVVKLEQNYRSTGHILEAANAVVEHNAKRKAKRLYTQLGEGELIHVYQAADERDEGRWIAAEAERLHRQGTPYSAIAVFYRTNAQSRVIEDMFLRAGVPYAIVGGTRFFDRAEVRDVMAYLKLVINPHDDVAARRVVNVPHRGIGATSVAKIQQQADALGLSFFEAAQLCVAEEGLLTPRTKNALTAWTSAIEEARHYSGDLANVVMMIVEKAGILDAYAKEHTPKAESKAENVREFFLIAQEFDESHNALEEEALVEASLARATLQAGQNPKDTSDPLGGALWPQAAFEAPDSTASVEPAQELSGIAKLSAFMEWLALRTDLDTLSGESSAVTLMTVHSAKGLEFPVVFVAGMEDGLFPHKGHDRDETGLEEERRLAYVAITRARRALYLTHALTRRSWGSTVAAPQSRFVREIPEEHVSVVGVGSFGFGGTGWEKRGDRHGTFGSGMGHSMYGDTIIGTKTRSTPRSVTEVSSSRLPTSALKPPAQAASKARVSFAPGDRVTHKTFGAGEVINATADIVEVKFDTIEKPKRLMLGFAPLVKVER